MTRRNPRDGEAVCVCARRNLSYSWGWRQMHCRGLAVEACYTNRNLAEYKPHVLPVKELYSKNQCADASDRRRQREEEGRGVIRCELST